MNIQISKILLNGLQGLVALSFVIGSAVSVASDEKTYENFFKTNSKNHSDSKSGENAHGQYHSSLTELGRKIRSKLHPETLPPAAVGPYLGEKGYYYEEVGTGSGLYWITDGAYTSMFALTGEGVIVVNAPSSLGSYINMAIKEVTTQPITHLIYTHSHSDHVDAAGVYPKNITVIAQNHTAEQFKRPSHLSLPQPTVTFDKKYTLSVGSQTLELEYRGPIHENGNIFVYSREHKALMIDDVIQPGWVPFKFLLWAQDIPSYVSAYDEILSFDFDTFLGGHVNRAGSRDDVLEAKEYLYDVIQNAGMALQATGLNVSGLLEMAEDVGDPNTWRVFNAFLEVVTSECEKNVLAKWGDRLGGADVFTKDNCWTAQQFLRVD